MNKTGNVRTYDVTIRRVRVSIVVVKEQIRIKYPECVPVFLPKLSGKQIAYFLRHITLLSVVCLARSIFLNYLLNGTILKKNEHGVF